MIDLRGLVDRLKVIESVAIVPRVRSTNEIARRVADECMENDIETPRAVIVAREQIAGRGRHGRTWQSPRDRGIWSTVLITRSESDAAIAPLAFGVAVAKFLEETFGVPARLKWPNDVVVSSRKIAGLLLEARRTENGVALIAGVGINLLPFEGEGDAKPISVAEAGKREGWSWDDAATAWVEYLDAFLAADFDSTSVRQSWSDLTVHRRGDAIRFHLGNDVVSGTWEGINEAGHAMIRREGGVMTVAAGEIEL